MIHSFEQINNVNGNVTVIFFEDNKKRQIIMTKGTEALRAYQDITIGDIDPGDYPDIKGAINKMKSNYIFKANPNNPSIFRPIVKTA